MKLRVDLTLYLYDLSASVADTAFTVLRDNHEF